jgi:PelA/Pel-15E family pectate lyase
MRMKPTTFAAALLVVVVVLSHWSLAAALPQAGPVLEPALQRSTEWFKSDEGKKLADIIVTWQNPEGGWWKDYDAKSPRPADLVRDENDAWQRVSTFDNGATYSEIRLLARAYAATKDEKYRHAFDRGLKFVFDAQYPNGGWPQRFPLKKDNYGKHITLNDRLMSSVMVLLKEVADGTGEFAFTTEVQRKQARESFDRGLECLLQMQIKAPDGTLTGWCQQHDAQTLAPTSARAYELPSIASYETADVVSLLMQIEKPDERVRKAITSAAQWFERSKITGKRYVRIDDKSLKYGVDRRLSDDPAAPPIWARFYEVETNKPIFADRDGVKRYDWHEVGEERRAKYAWYGDWGNKVLAELPKWKARKS